MTDLACPVARALTLQPLDVWLAQGCALAVSGGVDSMVLLHGLLAQAVALRGESARARLCVVHVHHGLQPQADDWLAFVQAQAMQKGLRFAALRLDAQTRPSAHSIEAWARTGRYQALAQMAQEQGLAHVLVAHHEDDQIETHVLQKNRGAGARGLAAMPVTAQLSSSVQLHRPFLALRKGELMAYAQARNIQHIEDPSNADARFARNALRARWRESGLSESQRQAYLADIHLAQAQLVQEQAYSSSMLAQFGMTHRPEWCEVARLSADVAQGRDSDELALIVREWLHGLGWRMPQQSALHELMRQLLNQRADQHMCWQHADGGLVAQYRGVWIAAMPSQAWRTPELDEKIRTQGWREGERVAGMRVRLGVDRPRVTLKHAYQMAGVPPMLRAHLPLLFCGERLVHVVGVGDVWV